MTAATPDLDVDIGVLVNTEDAVACMVGEVVFDDRCEQPASLRGSARHAEGGTRCGPYPSCDFHAGLVNALLTHPTTLALLIMGRVTCPTHQARIDEVRWDPL